MDTRGWGGPISYWEEEERNKSRSREGADKPESTSSDGDNDVQLTSRGGENRLALELAQTFSFCFSA